MKHPAWFIMLERVTELRFPDVQEQKAIGSFLHNIDMIVVDQQAKLEKLISLKSAYLNKMFI